MKYNYGSILSSKLYETLLVANTIDLEQQIIYLDKLLIFKNLDTSYLKVVKKFA